MTATEELRKLLDERGVKYTTDDGKYLKETCWRYMGELMAMFIEHKNGETRFELDHWYFTPEQAIAATLGNGECEFVIEDNMNESEGMGDVWFRCTNCDMTYDYYADDWLMKQDYCPHCGFKVRKAVKP